MQNYKLLHVTGPIILHVLKFCFIIDLFKNM
jgi:hypothetical protein